MKYLFYFIFVFLWLTPCLNLNAKVIERNFTWVGNKLVDDVIELKLSGSWGTESPTVSQQDFATVYVIPLFFGQSTQKVQNVSVGYMESNLGKSWVKEKMESASSITVVDEWTAEFTTKYGYHAGVVSQQLQGVSSEYHNTIIAVVGVNSHNLSQGVGLRMQLAGGNGQMNLEEVKIFTDGLRFVKISDAEISEDSSSNQELIGTSDSSKSHESEDLDNFDKVITITCGDSIKHDIDAFEVEAGTRVKLVLNNLGSLPKIAMGHNLIILKKGKDALGFGQSVLAAGGNASNPLPESVKVDIIANTSLLGPGESESILFTAPTELGVYEYLCSFPGHFGMERGIMTVIKGTVLNENSNNVSSIDSSLTLNSWTWNGAFPWIYNYSTSSWFYYNFNGASYYVYDARNSNWYIFNEDGNNWVLAL